jgi:Protein of unknown function (DUF3047)
VTAVRPAGAATALALVAAALVARADGPAPLPGPPAHALTVNATQWQVVQRESGPDDYYAVMHEAGQSFLRATYRPPERTAVVGFQLPDDLRSRARVVRWKWRALTLPRGGNECDSHKGDSAAVVYITFKRLLRWSTLKYVWSSVGPRGATCDKKRSPFSAQDTIILESGGPLGAWKSEEIDLAAEYRKHFEDGRADADVPDFVGIGLMTDGDQTQSESSADYGEFSVGW